MSEGPRGMFQTSDMSIRRFREPKQKIIAEPRKWKIYRNRRGWPTWYQRWLEAWWILTGQWSLHRAWQDGLDHGTAMGYKRTVVNGGR